MKSTSRNYQKPYRPLPVRFINLIGKSLEFFQLRADLSPQKLISVARQKTGFSVANDEWQQGLEILVESIEKEARLNTLGRLITRGRLISLIKNRLKAEALLRSKPEILEQKLATPLIITGLQRTGTTLLQRLVASDERFYSLTSWQVLDPVPPEKSSKKDSRVIAARRAQKGAAWLAPDFFAVHPIDYMAPEEEVLLLDLSFKSTVAEAIMRVPSYSKWLEEADSRPAYESLRKLLLIYQYENESNGFNRPFWVLKTPHHLEYLDVLMDVFPEAKIVQMHRDPVETSGSFLSMVAHGYGMFSDHPDPEEIGRHWVTKCKRMVDRGMKIRGRLTASEEKDKFLDIQYTEFMADKIETLKKIYNFAHIEYNQKTVENATMFLSKNKQHHFGRHVYDLSDFGYTPAQIHDIYQEYIKKYNIPVEKQTKAER